MSKNKKNLEIKKKEALKITLIISTVFFMFSFILNFIEMNFIDGIINGIVVWLFMLLFYFPVKAVLNFELNFTWYQWIFYVFGWLIGFFNLLFWLIMIITHNGYDFGDRFFSKGFHRRVYKWGFYVTIILVISGIFTFLLSLFIL